MQQKQSEKSECIKWGFQRKKQLKTPSQLGKNPLFNGILMLLTAFLLLLNSCDTPIEGCLDPSASNFAANADEDCCLPEDCCCTFPQLNINFFHFADTNNFRQTVFHPDAAGDTFRIHSFKFYLSNIELTLRDGSVVQVTDTIGLVQPDGSIPTPVDDYLLVKFPIQDYSIGTFRSIGVIEGLSFNIGLDESANLANPDYLAFNHPLKMLSDSMYLDEMQGRIFQRIQIQHQNAMEDTLTYSIKGVNNQVPIQLSLTKNILSGFDTEITIDIDYLKFFENVRFGTDDPATIIEQVKLNSGNVFTVRE